MSNETPYSARGGCQCGAVRFAVTARSTRIGLCHCRMCQKASGAPFASLADVPLSAFAWTRGQPGTFASSSLAVRDFCPACGTPLAYRQVGGDTIELMTGAFDDPASVTPTHQVGTEAKLAWTETIGLLPARTTQQASGSSLLAGLVNHQHPDTHHD